MIKIKITEDVMQHLLVHFQKDEVGSKFNTDSPEELLMSAMRLYPHKFREAVPDDDGRIRLSLTFPEPIGVSNVVSVCELTVEEKGQLQIVDRKGKNVRSVKTNRINSTKECQIILSSDWNLITMFPGEMAPPLPTSPEIHDEYWDSHIFIEPIK